MMITAFLSTATPAREGAVTEMQTARSTGKMRVSNSRKYYQYQY